MTIARQDAWNQDEDLLLAEVVLRHIKEGGTQLAAFEEVGRQLSRTSAACGFRWNSYIRKQYKEAIELAKQERKGQSVSAKQSDEDEPSEQPEPKKDVIAEKAKIPVQAMIDYLTELDHMYDNYEQLTLVNKKQQEEIANLHARVTTLTEENHAYQTKYAAIEQDYKALIGIMDRARKIVDLQGDE